jgi:hypothetical protein
MAHSVNRIPEPLIAGLQRGFTLLSSLSLDPPLLTDAQHRISHPASTTVR